MTSSTTRQAHHGNRPPPRAMHALLEQGQSVWLDDLRRAMTRSGELAAMIANGLRGMTSNPTIFEHAIAGSEDYDESLLDASMARQTDREMTDALIIRDVQEAADAFRPVYDATQGADGFVSIEVSPELARDTEGSILEARRLWCTVDRPNVMVKIPGTREGWPAIERCLREGININITLLFSLEHYQAVAEAYLRALEARVAEGLPVDSVASAASLFVSRVDTEVDKRIEAQGGALNELRGQVAVANARLVYAAFLDIERGARWEALRAHGARAQRPLWASTGTKNPAYSDVLYIETLIGPSTITTVPPDTLWLFEDHGVVERTLPGDVAGAERTMTALEEGGIPFADVNRTLEDEGIAKFSRSFEKLINIVGEKRQSLTNNSRAGSQLRSSHVPFATDGVQDLPAKADGVAVEHRSRRVGPRDATDQPEP